MTNEEEKALTILCIHNHPDGLTKGKIYNIVGESESYYDIKPDDFGHLSGFDKRYFENINDLNTH